MRVTLKEILGYWPTMIVVAVILYATLAAHPAGADHLPNIPYIDKLVHALMMGGLLSAFSFDWQRSHRNERLTPSFVWAVFGCVVAFSVADELVQGALPNGRDADPWDFLADCVGAVAAAYLAPPVIRHVLHIHARVGKKIAC